jgi:dihydroflavonol-4-reductase
MVHTSSVAAIGYTRSKDKPFGEHDWFETGPRLPYNRAKVESERLLNQLAKDYTTETVVVCPAMVLGALDYRVTPSNHYIQDLLNRDGITGRGGFNLVDVDDVARGHLLAADKGRAGGRYVLGGEHVEGRQLGRLIGEITGKAPIHISAPRWMSLAVAGLIEGGARLLGNEPPVTLMEARIHADRFSVYDESASRQELGYVAQPARITLERTASWLAHIGALNESVAKTVLERFPPDPSWFGEPRDDRRARKRREPLASAGHRTKTSPH